MEIADHQSYQVGDRCPSGLGRPYCTWNQASAARPHTGYTSVVKLVGRQAELRGLLAPVRFTMIRRTGEYGGRKRGVCSVVQCKQISASRWRSRSWSNRGLSEPRQAVDQTQQRFCIRSRGAPQEPMLRDDFKPLAMCVANDLS